MNSSENASKIGYRDVLTQKEYMKLLVANAVNRLGDAVDSITFTWLTYALTGSASWSAVIFGLNQVPTVVIQPLAAVWVEKIDKKKVMAITDLIRGFLVMILAGAYIFDLLTPWLLVVLTLSISSAEAFRIPAGTGILPQIINLDYYSFGSALNRTISTIMELIGTGLSGVILAVFGIPAAVGIDMLSYFISAGIIFFIRPLDQTAEGCEKSPQPADLPEDCSKVAHPSPLKAWWTDYKRSMKEGLAYMKAHPLIIKFCLLGIVANAMLVPINALITPIITGAWGQGAGLLSVFNTLLTSGTLVGGIVYPYIGQKAKPRTILISGGLILFINYACLASGRLFTTAAAAYIGMGVIAFLMGFGLALFSSCFSVLFVQSTDKDYLTRVSGILNSSSTAAMPVLSFIIGFLAAWIPSEIILLAGALLGVLFFIIIGIKKVNFDNSSSC